MTTLWSTILFLTLLALSTGVNAQVNPSATPTPTPLPGSRASMPGVADSTTFDRLRSVELMNPGSPNTSHPLLDPKKGIYRRPGKAETLALAVDAELFAKHADFLRFPNTGIVKLNAESSCVSVIDVIVATEKCVPFKIPGAGAAYSFRTESYRLPRLADLILFNEAFLTGGVLQHVAIANIGDVLLEDLTLDSDGVKYLVTIVPAADADEYTRFDEELRKGIAANGFAYGKAVPWKLNSTYALRSIAYRGKAVRSIDGVQYDELDMDTRRDVIVVFRTIDRDHTGDLTILWRVLKDVEAPKLKIKK